MTWEDFNREMSYLEACFPVSAEQRDSRQLRWKALFDEIGSLSVENLHEARSLLVKDGGAFLPTVVEILEACNEIHEEAQESASRASHFPVAQHSCSASKPRLTPLTKLIREMSPYEFEHLLCAGDIPATCPSCGKRHLERGLFAPMAKILNESLDSINDCFKGYLLCPKCPSK